MLEDIDKYTYYIKIFKTAYNIYYHPLFYISYNYILTKNNIKYVLNLRSQNKVIKSVI